MKFFTAILLIFYVVYDCLKTTLPDILTVVNNIKYGDIYIWYFRKQFELDEVPKIFEGVSWSPDFRAKIEIPIQYFDSHYDNLEIKVFQPIWVRHGCFID
jgi:hypothetical protein